MLKTIRVKTPSALSASCSVVNPDTFWTNHVYEVFTELHNIAEGLLTSTFVSNLPSSNNSMHSCLVKFVYLCPCSHWYLTVLHHPWNYVLLGSVLKDQTGENLMVWGEDCRVDVAMVPSKFCDDLNCVHTGVYSGIMEEQHTVFVCVCVFGGWGGGIKTLIKVRIQTS